MHSERSDDHPTIAPELQTATVATISTPLLGGKGLARSADAEGETTGRHYG